MCSLVLDLRHRQCWQKTVWRNWRGKLRLPFRNLFRSANVLEYVQLCWQALWSTYELNMWLLRQWSTIMLKDYHLLAWLCSGKVLELQLRCCGCNSLSLNRVAIKWLLLEWLTFFQTDKPSWYLANIKINSAFHPSGVAKLRNQVLACLSGVKAGRVHLCWVAANVVKSHVANCDTP